MQIKILGTRAKIKASAKAYENHSGYLIDDAILLDVGEAKFLNEEHKAIVFTHFHPDHAFFVFSNTEFKPTVPHFGPEKHPLVPDLQIIFDAFKIGEYTITPFSVIHSLNVKSLAYLVEKGNKKVFFTGDVAWIEKIVLKSLPKVDLIVTEGSFIEKGGRINRKGNRIYGHTGIPDLIRILKPFTHKILISHYGEWFFEDIPNSIEKLKMLTTDEVAIIPAYDGLIVTI